MRIVTTRAAARCAVCHDDLGGVAVACAGCDARGHADCWADLGRCPSLGCARRDAVRSPGRRRRWRLLGLLGLGATGALAASHREAPATDGDGGEPFLVVELLAVLSIVGLVAAVVAVNVMGRGYTSRVHRPAADMKAIGDALELFRVDCGYYPTTLDALWNRPPNAKKWGPQPYLKEYPPKDPWGNEYQYRLHGERRFEIVSYGADGAPGGDDEGTDLSSRTINNPETQ